MDELRALVGANIRSLRLKKGWTLEELAFRSGVHANYLGDAERGRRNLSVSSLNKIAAGLGVEPAALLRGLGKAGGAAAEDKLYAVARRFLALVRDKSESERRTLLRILRAASRGMEEKPRRKE